MKKEIKRLKPSDCVDYNCVAPCKEDEVACGDGDVTNEYRCMEPTLALESVSEGQMCKVHSFSKCKTFAKPCVFSLEKISRILYISAEHKFCTCDSKIIGACVERIIRELVAESVELCKSKKRRTLFKDDVEHTIRKRGIFFLFDLVDVRDSNDTCQ